MARTATFRMGVCPAAFALGLLCSVWVGRAQGAVAVLDHFTVYAATGPDAPPVLLTDQFYEAQAVDLGLLSLFLVPADKNLEGIINEFDHLACYEDPGPTPLVWEVDVLNQFGAAHLTVTDAAALCVPTEKYPPAPPLVIDHYRCYQASGLAPGALGVDLVDQFQPQTVEVQDPFLFCNPVDKNSEGVGNLIDHLTCYYTFPPQVPPPLGLIPIANQFHAADIEVLEAIGLCVPSEKTAVGPTTTTTTTTSSTTTTSTTLPTFLLDHFTVYEAFGPDAPLVSLIDQFYDDPAVDLGPLNLFLVPANKNGEGINNDFDHLACYDDPGPTPLVWEVDVLNQFGPAHLTVTDAAALCVPTAKLVSGPLTIDHYRCYQAVGSALGAFVTVEDQFQLQAVDVLDPFLFCNPADKNGEGIGNAVDHLTCYHTVPPGLAQGPFPFSNQFDDDVVDIFEPIGLCVPSLKTAVAPPTTTSTTLVSTTTTSTSSVSSIITTTSTTSTTSSTTTTLPPAVTCASGPTGGCIAAAAGVTTINEKVAGKEKFKAVLKKLGAAVAQSQFGDPVSGTTSYAICVYNQASALVAQLQVNRAGATCVTKPCWKAITTKGWKYSDKAQTADGVKKIVAKGGAAGKGKIVVKASNVSGTLPIGVAAALSGNSQARVQVLTSDAACFDLITPTVKRADGIIFKAKAP